MNSLGEMVAAVASWVFWTSVAGSILALLVSLVHRGLARVLSARWGYVLWYLVFLRLIIPYSPPSELSLFNLRPAEKDTRTPPPAIREQEASQPSVVIPADQPVLTPLPAPVASLPLLTWISYTWLAGAATFLLLVLVQHRKLARRLSSASLAEAALQIHADQVRHSLRIKRPVAVLVTDLASTPALFGWWRPRLLLPRSRLSEWSAAELDWVFRHELTHVKRHDVLMNWALIGVQIVHWFNPIIWWALRRLRAERELVCDAAVLKGLTPPQRQAYGSLLIRLMDASALPNPILVPILSHKHHLKRRIAMIAESKPPRYAWIVALLACIGLACLTFTRAAETPPTEPKSTARSLEREAEQAVLVELKTELERMDEEIRRHEATLDAMQAQYDLRSSARETSQLIDTLESQRLEARSEYTRINILRNQLKQMDSTRLRRTALTLLPDPSLQALLDAEAKAEQQMTQMKSTYTPDHPEVKSLGLVLESINRQIDERIGGLQLGLETQIEVAQERTELLSKELEEARAMERQTSSRQRPYSQVQRSLENLQEVRDRLHKRILLDEINLKLPPSAKLDRGDSELRRTRRTSEADRVTSSPAVEPAPRSNAP